MRTTPIHTLILLLLVLVPSAHATGFGPGDAEAAATASNRELGADELALVAEVRASFDAASHIDLAMSHSWVAAWAEPALVNDSMTA